MQDGLYRIGEVSRITGISRDTLHFYDKIGLLTPEYVGPENRYRYYSRKNLWELDIITICRSLDLPLERIREILSLRDNGKIAGILMAYRQEALRRRDYYDRVAADIQWYHDEIGQLDGWHCPEGVRLETFPARTVVTGAKKRGRESYHANLQRAARDLLQSYNTIRRRYGYVLDFGSLPGGTVDPVQEYLILEDTDLSGVKPENRMTIPAGEYAVAYLQIRDWKGDFGPLMDFVRQTGREPGAVYAEEMGLQLFAYTGYPCRVLVRLG